MCSAVQCHLNTVHCPIEQIVAMDTKVTGWRAGKRYHKLVHGGGSSKAIMTCRGACLRSVHHRGNDPALDAGHRARSTELRKFSEPWLSTARPWPKGIVAAVARLPKPRAGASSISNSRGNDAAHFFTNAAACGSDTYRAPVGDAMTRRGLLRVAAVAGPLSPVEDAPSVQNIEEMMPLGATSYTRWPECLNISSDPSGRSARSSGLCSSVAAVAGLPSPVETGTPNARHPMTNRRLLPTPARFSGQPL